VLVSARATRVKGALKNRPMRLLPDVMAPCEAEGKSGLSRARSANTFVPLAVDARFQVNLSLAELLHKVTSWEVQTARDAHLHKVLDRVATIQLARRLCRFRPAAGHAIKFASRVISEALIVQLMGPFGPCCTLFWKSGAVLRSALTPDFTCTHARAPIHITGVSTQFDRPAAIRLLGGMLCWRSAVCW
jgi:hypothetical protein